MLFDPNPAAFVAKLHDALGPVADQLRNKGAVVEFVDKGGAVTHIIVMMVTLRCPLNEAVAETMKLKKLAERTDGTIYGTLLTHEKTDVPDGEYRVALSYTVAKRRRAA